MVKDKIISIRPVGIRKTKDISISGNRLFYANGILTHNSGFGAAEIDLTNTGDSLGFVQTADIVIAITERLTRLIKKNIPNAM